MNNKTIVERNIGVNTRTINQRNLIVLDQKRNLECLKEVLLEIGFVVESVEVDPRELHAPFVKFINHEKKAEKFNSLLSVMGLSNYRVTPRGKLRKLESILQSNQNRNGNRRTQNISRMAKVTPDDIKLLADLLKSKQRQITSYLSVLKDLEI
ncbi:MULTISPECIES: hypothetical protein [Bacillaceae]|uniref:Uncharacterized protein n=1 Tax=Alkalicoccobacillus plakortidis TaxID=444060 RepID=A0A9D5I107_9BACI|nr:MULTISPECIES: hypothetical protein [Bacillaceae]KQL57127.1 hypothetical protein AN965_10680 [Alkalicoccobacillus plakortidis]